MATVAAYLRQIGSFVIQFLDVGFSYLRPFDLGDTSAFMLRSSPESRSSAYPEVTDLIPNGLCILQN